MTAENRAYRKLFVRAFIVLFVLAGLFLLSSWAGRSSEEIEGPSRLVRGPHDSVYVRIDRSIVKVSSEGELLSVLDLSLDASVPDLADFFVEEDGRLLFARRDSRLLQYYSPEGGLLTSFLRMPLQPVGEDRSWSLTKDPSTGVLYLADTSRDCIRIFGPDGKEVRTITVPSSTAGSSLVADWSEGLDLERIYSSKTPLRHPKGLTLAGGSLIAADNGNARIVLFYPDGTFDKIVPVFPMGSSSFINPVRVDRAGDTLYAIVRGPGLAGGKVQTFEFNTGLPREFRYPGSSDPSDILARHDDLLVADHASLTVMRYAHTGRFLGIFGRPGLQSLYAGSQFKRKTYEWISTGSLASMVGIFVWLLYTAAARVTALENVLGPPRSARRRMLLLIPGVGQAASGRPLRAVILLLALLYFAAAFIYSLLQHQSQAHKLLSVPELTASGFVAYSVWMLVVLDGIRLTGRPAENKDPSAEKRRRLAAFAPLITVCSAIAAQLVRESIVQSYPGAPSVIRQLFLALCTATGGHASLFEMSLPASILFGWGGAGAALFGTFAWQAHAGRSAVTTGIVAGFLAGIYSWLFTVAFAWTGPDWMLYAPPVQGLLLGMFTYLYFRSKGMPVLIVPAAVAGAWVGYFLKFFFGVFAGPIGKIFREGDGGIWTGAIARLELIVIPALFVHLAIWITWNSASDRTAGNVEPAIRKEEECLVSSYPKEQTPVES